MYVCDTICISMWNLQKKYVSVRTKPTLIELVVARGFVAI